MKTVRFSQVVARSGKPEPHTLWTAPGRDRELQAALKQHRVMTVHQETTGQKKDYGQIGFTEDRKGNLLIFPKSLKTFEGSRVVGVKYDLLEEASAKREPAPPAARKTPPKPAPAPSKPAELRVFRPEEEPEEKAPAKKERPAPAPSAGEEAKLRAAIRQAMKQLQSGKAVAAYQTLEKAVKG